MMDYKHDPGSALSVASSTDTLLEPVPPVPTAVKRLYIRAKGIGLIRLPLPMSQSEVPIYGEDGSLAYVATKERAWSGRWVLSAPQRGPLVSMAFLPGGRPQLRRLDPQTGIERPSSIGLRGKWASRAVTFATPEGDGSLEWKYVKTTRADGTRATALRLEQTEERGGLLHTRRAAQFVGTSTGGLPAAGQGGQLEVEGWVDEAVVVASCLAMLRRERDRRRFVQAMVIGAGGS